MLPCRIKGDVFQTVVWTMKCPGKPDVMLIGECHVGSKEYFEKLSNLLGETTPQVWAGIEGLRAVEDESDLSRAVRKRLKLLRHEMELRCELATYTGLITRRDGLPKNGRTVIGPDDDKYVADWGIRRVFFMRVINSGTQKLVARCKAGDRKAVTKCRKQVAGRYRGIARFLTMPQRVERSINEDTEWNNLALAHVAEELKNGREVRLLMGALHILALRRMMEDKGYTVSSEAWQDCANLALLVA